MRWNTSATVLALVALSVVVSGGSKAPEVVTNPMPALSATMSAVTDDTTGGLTWVVQGKVKPSYRGHGATVHLLCVTYGSIIGAGGQSELPPRLLFPPSECSELGCPGDAANVDSCGNFGFSIAMPSGVSQLPPDYSCSFIVHVDDSKTPQACNQTPVIPSNTPVDPNGSGPCGGALCPDNFR
jgi:hypothetical protein